MKHTFKTAEIPCDPRSFESVEHNRTEAARVLLLCGWSFDDVAEALGVVAQVNFEATAEPEPQPQPEFLYENMDFREMPGVFVGRRIGHLGADFASIYLDEAQPR